MSPALLSGLAWLGTLKGCDVLPPVCLLSIRPHHSHSGHCAPLVFRLLFLFIFLDVLVPVLIEDLDPSLPVSWLHSILKSVGKCHSLQDVPDLFSNATASPLTELQCEAGHSALSTDTVCRFPLIELNCKWDPRPEITLFKVTILFPAYTRLPDTSIQKGSCLLNKGTGE